MPEQLHLYRHRWHQRLQDRIVARLLWAANTSPPSMHRREFYSLKDQLLHRYGTIIGRDIQHIRKPCWSCYGSGDHPHGWICRRCDGSGIFAEFWVVLTRWQFAGHVFHTPTERMAREPDEPVTIEGYVTHARIGKWSKEALLWLTLIYDRRLCRALLTRGGRYLGWYAHPLCNVQRLTYLAHDVAQRVRRRRCWCGRHWRPLWERGHWCVCRRCRKRSEPLEPIDDGQEIPF